MQVTIRAATSTDARAIAAVHVASWRVAYQGIVSEAVLNQLSVRRRSQHWTKLLSEHNVADVVYVAVDEQDEIIGFAHGGQERENDPTFSGELFAIYLLQETQRMGIGRNLALTLLHHLQSQDHAKILIWVLASNPARHFFTAIGAIPTRERTLDIDGVAHTEIGLGWE